MSSGTQAEMDWAGTGAAPGEPGLPPASAGNGAGRAAYLTDEEILGIDPPSSAAAGGYGGRGPLGDGNAVRADGQETGAAETSREAEARVAKGVKADGSAALTTGAAGNAQMPAWMQSAAADPRHGAEAAQLWREHQEFHAAFGSPEEARAVRELLPGGARDVLSLREATQSVERIDAALFSGDARAQSEVVAELARANPAAFRSLFAEAAKVLAGLGARGNDAGGREARNLDGSATNVLTAEPTLRENGEGWGTRNSEVGGWRLEAGTIEPSGANESTTAPDNRLQDAGAIAPAAMPSANHQTRVTSHQSPFTGAQGKPAASHESQITNHAFDPAAYAAFERATNEAVGRDVRGSISDTLARVLPEGVAEGAAWRIGEDIFHEIHRALAADRTLSEQVAAVLRDPPSPNGGAGGPARRSLGGGGPRFGAAEQQRVASLLAGRAKQLVPSIARRVIGEWTSSVLNTSRSKAARQAASASRVDIAAPGGSRDSMPLRQMSPREVNYASISDEEILGM